MYVQMRHVHTADEKIVLRRRPTVEHLTYAPDVSRPVYGSSPLGVGVWHFILDSRHVQHADFIIFALSSDVYLNFLNYWKAES